MTDAAWLRRIRFTPQIFGGKPIIRGLRISVELIASLLAQGGRHCGVVRLPAVPAHPRIAMRQQVLERHRENLDGASIVTVCGGSEVGKQHRSLTDAGKGELELATDEALGRVESPG